MKKKFAIRMSISTLFLFLLSVDVLPADEISGQDGKIHTVVRGDTLWDLSETYLGNPFLWPKLWQWNDYITNPHFIYPDDQVKLYPPKVTLKRAPKEVEEVAEEVMEEAPKEAEIAPAEEVEVVEEVAEENRLFFPQVRSSGLVSTEEMRNAGNIVEAKDEKVMLSDDDIIYVGLKEQFKEGDMLTIFKTDREVIHPVSKKSLGYKVITLGFAKITGFSDGLGIARITKSFDAINRGDLVTPKEEIPEEIVPTKAKFGLEGYIVSSKEERINFGEGDIVYIDLGRNKGLETGNTFIVYRTGEVIKDKKKKTSYTLPSTTIGRIITLATKEETSVGIITNSVEEMKIGERIRAEME